MKVVTPFSGDESYNNSYLVNCRGLEVKRRVSRKVEMRITWLSDIGRLLRSENKPIQGTLTLRPGLQQWVFMWRLSETCLWEGMPNLDLSFECSRPTHLTGVNWECLDGAAFFMNVLQLGIQWIK